MSQFQNHKCNCHPTVCAESLHEMDFRKGIWGAALDGDLKRVEMLAERGVDVKDVAGYTALHYASRNGNYDVCNKLLQCGASPNAKTNALLATPLHRAALAGHTDIVKLLLKYRADASLQDADGQTALHRAAVLNQYDLVESLAKASPESIKVPDNKGRLPVDLLKELHGNLSKCLELLTFQP